MINTMSLVRAADEACPMNLDERLNLIAILLMIDDLCLSQMHSLSQ